MTNSQVVNSLAQSRLLMTLRKKPFENIVGKGEYASKRKQHFLLFPQCFLLYATQIQSFESCLNCHLQLLLISSFSKELNELQVFDRVGNIVGEKGKKVVYQHFLLFQTCTQKASSSGL